MSGLQRGSKNAQAARKCDPCRKRNHTQCTHELGVIKARDSAELRRQGFTIAREDIPFCACYAETDIHL